MGSAATGVWSAAVSWSSESGDRRQSAGRDFYSPPPPLGPSPTAAPTRGRPGGPGRAARPVGRRGARRRRPLPRRPARRQHRGAPRCGAESACAGRAGALPCVAAETRSGQRRCRPNPPPPIPSPPPLKSPPSDRRADRDSRPVKRRRDAWPLAADPQRVSETRGGMGTGRRRSRSLGGGRLRCARAVGESGVVRHCDQTSWHQECVEARG